MAISRSISAERSFPFSASRALSLSLATFGAGFLTRPIGAIVIGSMGDRIGRKPAMLLSFTLMGVAIVGLALTPSYARIGVAAPILVLLFRLLQGFALGGEVGPTTAYLVEAAPIHRRGFYASMAIHLAGCRACWSQAWSARCWRATLDAQALQDWGLARGDADGRDHRALRADDPQPPAGDIARRR